MKGKIVLGIDFGERRIGLAISDASLSLATGYGTLDRREVKDVMSVLKKIVDEENVGRIVIGYPLRTDGRRVEGEKTEAVDAFIEELEKSMGLPVEREDEAFTSVIAQQTLKARSALGFSVGGGRSAKKAHGQRGKRKAQKEAIDRLAACAILQDWLDRKASPTTPRQGEHSI